MHLFYEMPNSVTHQGRVLVLYVLFKTHKMQAAGKCLYLIKHGFKWFLINNDSSYHFFDDVIFRINVVKAKKIRAM